MGGAPVDTEEEVAPYERHDDVHPHRASGTTDSTSSETGIPGAEAMHSLPTSALLAQSMGAMNLTSSDRCIDIDDISEIRPGKISAYVDGSEDLPLLTIVASETILCLPVANVQLRNNLIRRFQAFVEVSLLFLGITDVADASRLRVDGH